MFWWQKAVSVMINDCCWLWNLDGGVLGALIWTWPWLPFRQRARHRTRINNEQAAMRANGAPALAPGTHFSCCEHKINSAFLRGALPSPPISGTLYLLSVTLLSPGLAFMWSLHVHDSSGHSRRVLLNMFSDSAKMFQKIGLTQNWTRKHSLWTRNYSHKWTKSQD